jgi:dTDP-4-amino-4,6-dideoxygalactose transaminase
VEEFWDEGVLESLMEEGRTVLPIHFAEALAAFLKTCQRIWLVERAGTGLRRLLLALKASGRSSVLICDFNCMIVADAVTAAGLEVETFDVGDRSGQIDWDLLAGQLDKRHAAIVVPHLFGVPTDFRPLLPRASDLGVHVIEDCSHTLGGTIGGRMAGTIGDAAIFSFNYDKPLSLGGGGALCWSTAASWPRASVFPNQSFRPRRNGTNCARFAGTYRSGGGASGAAPRVVPCRRGSGAAWRGW